MFKSSRLKIAALSALVFGVAMSFGAVAWENNGPCWNCHTACDDARIACVASGSGYCMRNYRTCVAGCAATIPGCEIP